LERIDITFRRISILPSLSLSCLAGCLPYPPNNLPKATPADIAISRRLHPHTPKDCPKGCGKRGELALVSRCALGGARRRDSFRFKYQKQFRHPRGGGPPRATTRGGRGRLLCATSARRVDFRRTNRDGYYDACGTPALRVIKYRPPPQSPRGVLRDKVSRLVIDLA